MQGRGLEMSYARSLVIAAANTYILYGLRLALKISNWMRFRTNMIQQLEECYGLYNVNKQHVMKQWNWI